MRKPRRPAATTASSTSQRDLVPAELRYQFLRAGPGRSPWAVRGVGVAVGVLVGLALFGYTGMVQAFFVVPVVAGLVGWVFAGVARLIGPSKEYRALPVGIVPWGLVIDPDGASIAVTWRGLRELSFVRVGRDGNRDADVPHTAVMLFNTEAGVVQAQGEDGEWVTTIDAFAPRFARAAPRGPSADIEGTEPLDMAEVPGSLALLRRAEALLQSAEGRASLGLEGGDYRTTSSKVAGPETRALLRAALWEADAKYDPGPLAAVLAAELGVEELLPDLLRLILSTSPLLSATARAAALRLGASPVAAGSLDELQYFLPDADIAELRRWAQAGRQNKG